MRIFSRLSNNFRKLASQDKWFLCLLIQILLIAIFLHFYNFENRIFVQADNSRDGQVAVFAATNLKFPLIGQFSSAGPFFYGPWYYWFLEILSFLPFGFLGSWLVIKSVYFLYIVLFFFLGKEVGGKRLGALCSLFASVSPAQINYSFSIWNPAIVPILVLVSLTLFVRFCKRRTFVSFFLLSLIVGLSLTIHFQNILILPTLLVAFFLIKPNILNYLKYFLAGALGLLIPFLPLIYFDLKFDGYNFKSIIVYLFVDQYKIWIPNRWLIYIFHYWPETWSYIVGGNRFAFGAIVGFLAITGLLKLKYFKKNYYFYLISFIFLLEVLLFRYYRGERYQYYSLFAHTPVILLSAWACFQLSKIHKLAGSLLIFAVIFGSLYKSLEDFKERGVTIAEVRSTKSEIYEAFPNKTFSVYGCTSNPNVVSHPLALSMYFDKKDDINGIRIGVCESINGISWRTLAKEEVGGKNTLWYNRSTEAVYVDTTEWWKRNPPGGGDDDLWRFLLKALFSKSA